MTEARSEAPKTIRCSSCGGLNPSTAQWCGQCLSRFAPPAPPEPPSDLAPGERPRARVSPLLTGGMVEGETRGAFRVTEEGILWTCRACETENPIELERCSACGTPFGDTLRGPEEAKVQRDPGKTAMFSLFLPGAGHAYLGLWGQAIARAVISVWVVFTALMGAVQRSGGTVIAIVFGFAATALWIVGAHDAYREAEGNRSLVLLKGKLFLYVVLGLLLVLLVLLVTAGLSARSARA